ncbi:MULTISPECIES: class I SAM-dependent methyltransferase [unclassified Lysobacter]|uniref:class I SAM-dependent methyltransferase n=1 Tax=unclassified Lysobacter TaxID=2635362 RepID=UPI00255204F9|nr:MULTISPECIES: class I SAM-dependent methyltransferase [unclassified Lysobacter]
MALAGAGGGLRSRFRGYSGARPDVVRLLPPESKRVLDVGCGAGMSAALIRERCPQVRVIGVEPSPELAAHARENLDEILQGRIDDPETIRALAAREPFDAIICADVLEHLAEPLPVLQALTERLAVGGCVITSIPNVRHLSTFLALGLLGTWPARDRGIHDRTHLRFFARGDIIRLGRSAGLEPRGERRNVRLIESKAWSLVPAKCLDFWPFRGFVTFQYLHRWVRADRDRGD